MRSDHRPILATPTPTRARCYHHTAMSSPPTDHTPADALVPDKAEQAPPRRRRGRRLLRLALYLVVFYLVWICIVFFSQDWLLFPADLAPDPLPTRYSAQTEEIARTLSDGANVVAWFVPAPNASPERPGPCVVFFHGNAEIIDIQHHVIGGYQALGWAVLLPEYRGYGRSGGAPSETALVDDALWFLKQIEQRPDVDPDRIVLHGRSLGGGVAAQVAARRRPVALIFESTFTSVRAMASKYAVPRFLARHRFDTDRVLAGLDVPVLLMHGTHDNIIPVAHGRRLHEIAPNSTFVEFDAKHNDFPGEENLAKYWNAVMSFLRSHGVFNRPAGESQP